MITGLKTGVNEPNMVSFRSVAACFPVADVDTTLAWYEQNLGFTSHPFPAKPPSVFGILVRDTVEIMLQKVEGYQKPERYSQRPGGVWDAYIRITDIEQLYEQLKDRVTVLMTLRQQPYGDWEFEIKDLNAYVLVFSELKQ